MRFFIPAIARSTMHSTDGRASLHLNGDRQSGALRLDLLLKREILQDNSAQDKRPFDGLILVLALSVPAGLQFLQFAWFLAGYSWFR